MSEKVFQILGIRRLANHKRAVSIKAAIRRHNMEVRIEILEISKAVYSNDSTRNCIIIGDALHQVSTQYVPCTQTQLGQETSIKHEISPQDLGNTEYPLPVGHVFQYILTQGLSKNYHPLLVT